MAIHKHKMSVRLGERDVYVGRFPYGGLPEFEQLELGWRGGVGMLTDLAAKDAELARDPRLSDLGRQEARKDFALRDLIPRGRKLRGTLEGSRRKLEELKGRLRPFPARKPDDLAGALLDWEIRSLGRSLPAEDRWKFVHDGGPEVKRAVLSAPCELSGLSVESYRALFEAAIGEQHADLVEEIDRLQQAHDAAQKALDTVSGDIEN